MRTSGLGALALTITAMGLLAGCAAGDIELNGKLFDALGVNSTNSSGPPKLAERSALVVPPGLDRLPAPGEKTETETGALDEINDPDQVKTADKAELERQQAEYCKVNYEQAKARGDLEADHAKGPLGPCRGSIFTALKTWSGSDEE